MARTSTRWDTTQNGTEMRGRSNGMAIAALVCGIIGLFILEIILGPLAIIFGGLALQRANRGAGQRGMAWAGLILGVIDVLGFIVILALARHHGFYWRVGG
jgi:Domain of unknown function (DUF4190)